MKIAFFINTPAQVHFYKNITKELEQRGHKIRILARDCGITLNLLDELGFRYFVFARVPKSKYGKILTFPFTILVAYKHLRKFNPDLLVGSTCSAYTSKLLRKPDIIFTDSCIGGPMRSLEIMMSKPFADAILTTDTFEKDLGKKHLRINGYKELAYLHPNYFKPDKSIFNLLGIDENEDFVLLRFNAFGAIHDIGIGGFSVEGKRKLVEELEKYAKVFISSEAELPHDLKQYSIKIPKHRIHDVLYYAKMIVADTGTMITESAILGTPAIVFHHRSKILGNFIGLEQKYGLIFTYNDDPDRAIEKAVELMQQSNLKEEWQKKRERLLKDKIDVTAFMIEFIENYPESFKDMKENPNVQEGSRWG